MMPRYNRAGELKSIRVFDVSELPGLFDKYVAGRKVPDLYLAQVDQRAIVFLTHSIDTFTRHKVRFDVDPKRI